MVHRPRYDDWTLPKGKLDRGESFEEAALREVGEETGLRCRLVRELASTEYRDNKDRPKIVRYWLMEVEGGEFAPNDEVDEVRWLALDEAAASGSPTSATGAAGCTEALSGSSATHQAAAQLARGRLGRQPVGPRPRLLQLAAHLQQQPLAQRGPTSCTAVGRPSSPWAIGTEIAGWPVTLNGAV